jgi:hypothetical protein
VLDQQYLKWKELKIMNQIRVSIYNYLDVLSQSKQKNYIEQT